VEHDSDGAGLVLWWQLGPDLALTLAQAVACFQTKPAFGGARPGVVRACPTLAADGIRGPAEALGLRVVADPRVLAGTVYLERG
jgi:hypothetical protein